MPLDVHVVTPERELWSGEASTVVARGVAIGPLRILRGDGPEITAVVDGGFMHVTSDGDATRVDVLAANAQMREEIDVEDARRRVSELEDRLRERDTADAEADLAGVKESLLRAQARINLAG
jgi:F-type H+-transporting ATPase subunit epsilon